MKKQFYNNYSRQAAAFTLRIGIAFVFGYAVFAFFSGASNWSQFYPRWAADIVSADIFLSVFSVYEVMLVIWLLSGKWLSTAALIAAVTIFLLTAVNLHLFDILFRNVAIFCSAVALMFLSTER